MKHFSGGLIKIVRSRRVFSDAEQGSGMLLAFDELRELDADRLAFLARAWRAAYYEAKSRGWLESGLDVAGAAKH